MQVRGPEPLMRWLAPLLLLVMLSGCGKVGYYLHLAEGQWQLSAARTPIGKVIAAPETPAGLAAALRDVRPFIELPDLVVEGPPKLNGAGMMAAGSAMALGILPRVSALSLVGLLIPTTIVGHPFWKETEDAAKQTQMTSFASNTAVAGGLLMVAAS